ncbi:MAG: recombination regulator RecX [Lachnospiraceae bacterium]|nr:recombination regulator RecX [Lachnospiraceae bacterium]
MREFDSVEDMVKHARKKAMSLLEVQDRTRKQLYDKLKTLGYPESVVDNAISYVESFHYLDDYRYAENYIRYRQSSKSRQQLKIELLKKGVCSDLIERAMEETYEADESAMIMELLKKKHYNPQDGDMKQRNRIMGYLMRRGYSLDDIKRCMKAEDGD